MNPHGQPFAEYAREFAREQGFTVESCWALENAFWISVIEEKKSYTIYFFKDEQPPVTKRTIRERILDFNSKAEHARRAAARALSARNRQHNAGNLRDMPAPVLAKVPPTPHARSRKR